MKTLRELTVGEIARVIALNGEGALRQHLLDMGVIPGAEVSVVKFAPMGDPMEILIHGYKLSLRLADAETIDVEPVSVKTLRAEKPVATARSEHPGLGEGGRFHSKEDEDPLPPDETLTFALIGNQNCGKTTLFNQLTGSNQHVGNFPGVTVDRKDGVIKGYPNTLVTDLPGIYSMSPYSGEEIVSRNFVLDQKPKAIINIVDATNIERNLYLTMQLLEMDVPMVVALNMMDDVAANGGSIDINEMENMLGVPVVPISAAKKQGVKELIEHAVHVAKYRERPLKQDFCDETDNGGAVHRCLHAVRHLIDDHAEKAGLPVRFATEKVIEGDNLVIERLGLDQNEIETIEHVAKQMEIERGLDKQAAMAEMRFAFIFKVCSATVIKPAKNKGRAKSEKIDAVLTGKYTAIPIFLLIMAGVFFLTFYVIGGNLQYLMELGISALSDITDRALPAGGVSEILHGLIIDGIFAGVGGVLSFLPVIVTMFLLLSLLEDSGYIARVAFFMDKLLRKIGLSGRSIVPMLIGFGCTVPAVMSTRTLPSERDRKMTVLLTPFMSCSAKMPIYAFFVNAFFPRYKVLIMIGLYVFGMLIGVLVALLMKRTLFKGEAVPFVMELPNYRMPGVKNVLRLIWEKAKDFLQRAFTVIFVATIVVWLLQSFDYKLNPVEDSQNSILAMIAGWIAPVFKPLGFADWRIGTSLISGFMAKESVVSTMEVLFEGPITDHLSAAAAASLTVFSLLYTPCVAAIASIKREMGIWWALGVIVWQCAIAWIAAFIVSNIISLFTSGLSVGNIIVIALLSAAVIAAVVSMITGRKKQTGCHGNCAACSGCAVEVKNKKQK